MTTSDCQDRLKAKKALIVKERIKRHQRKTLTVSTPFELRTQKRMRMEIEGEQIEKQEQYEPLWAQIQKNFQLRESKEGEEKQRETVRELTKPKSPVFHTEKRMKLKDDFTVASADKA